MHFLSLLPIRDPKRTALAIKTVHPITPLDSDSTFEKQTKVYQFPCKVAQKHHSTRKEIFNHLRARLQSLADTIASKQEHRQEAL